MKKFFVSLAAIIIFLWITDRLGGQLMMQCLSHTNAKAEVKIENMVKKVNDDVVLMGTSRCAYHYVPSIIMDSINASVYNGGISASDNIYSHYILLNLMLLHHTPKVVCLELMSNDFKNAGDPFDKITYFAPYFGHSKSADSVYIEAGTYWRYELSKLYRFNSKGIEALAGLFVNHRYGEDNGFFKILGNRDNSMTLRSESKDIETDTLKLKYIQRFINTCKEKGIKLVFTISPKYSIVSPTYYIPLKILAEQNKIPILDYHSIGLFHDKPEYFKNNAHLLEEGAKMYSSIFASDLKRLMEQ